MSKSKAKKQKASANYKDNTLHLKGNFSEIKLETSNFEILYNESPCHQKSGDRAIQKAFYKSEQIAGNDAVQMGGSEVSQSAGEFSFQIAGAMSNQSADRFSVQYAGNDSFQSAVSGSVSIANCVGVPNPRVRCRHEGRVLQVLILCDWDEDDEVTILSKLIDDDKEHLLEAIKEDGEWKLKDTIIE